MRLANRGLSIAVIDVHVQVSSMICMNKMEDYSPGSEGVGGVGFISGDRCTLIVCKCIIVYVLKLLLHVCL